MAKTENTGKNENSVLSFEGLSDKPSVVVTQCVDEQRDVEDVEVEEEDVHAAAAITQQSNKPFGSCK
jgi:hypothetical protein